MNSKLILIFSIFSLLIFIRLLLFFFSPPIVKEGSAIRFETTLLTDPTENANYEKFSARYYLGFSSLPLQIIIPRFSGIHYGQHLLLSGKLMRKTLPDKKVIFVLYYPKLRVAPSYTDRFLEVGYFLRHNISLIYHSVLPPTSASLLLGIVLGVKETMSKSFLTNLQSVGVVHVIAASGMNVTMVAAFLISFLSRMLNRRLVLLISIFAIGFYALISGLQPSIVRAAIMTIMVFTAQLYGRQYTAWYSLLVTSGFMLFIQPELAGDIGFQLSVLSTLGILFIKPVIPDIPLITDDAGTTIAAQLMTVPVLLINFGQYGLLSILVNALVLWMIPILMILGGIGGLAGLCLPFFGRGIILLCLPFLLFFETIVHLFGSLQLQISTKSVPLLLIFGYYFVLIFLVIFIKKNQQK